MNDINLSVSPKELSIIYDVAFDVIDSLPPSAIDELFSGGSQDLDNLFSDFLFDINSVVNSNGKIISEYGGLENFAHHFDESLKIQSYNYFKSTMLPNFNQGWRNIEMGNMFQMYPWSAYLASRSSGKTEVAGTEIIMFDGSLKKIEDIVVGDKVMGVDSTVRTVLSTHTCEDDAYLIRQSAGLDYIVNSQHILHFKRDKTKRNNKGKWMTKKQYGSMIVEMSTEDLYAKSKYYQSHCWGYRVNGWELPEKDFFIDPYILGTWLGDGHSNCTKLTNVDQSIIDAWRDFANKNNLIFRKLKAKYGYSIVGQNKGTNAFLHHLQNLNLIKNKHIPEIYFQGSRQQRLELLAGIIDTDGSYPKMVNTFEIAFKYNTLAKDVQRLAWSLGFRCSLRTRIMKIKYLNYREYKRDELNISIDLHVIPTRVYRKRARVEDAIQDRRRSSMKIKKIERTKFYGFYIDGDHLYLHKDGTVMHNSFEACYAWPLWRMYRYRKPPMFTTDTWDNKNSKETVIITNESKLGKKHLEKITSEIQNNDLLRERLKPDGGVKGIEKFTAKNGALVELRSFGSFIRGLHVGSVVVDDFLDKSALYSAEQRGKFSEVFNAEIKNIVEPHGHLLVTGTPFSKNDLYAELKEDSTFKVFEYPGIYPDGQLLAPDRLSYKKIMELRHSLGSIVFAREILVTPIDDASSIFPWEYLNKAFINMERVNLVENIESFPIKMDRVVIGCDFAISGNTGADFSVFSVWGIDSNKQYYLINVWREKGASHDTQVNQIVKMNNLFKPNQIVCENNGFQRILIEMVRARGIQNVKEFTTTGNKKDLYAGLPSLSAAFERGEIKIPYGNEKSKNTAQWLCGEFNSIVFDDDRGKLESADGHDDGCMSTWFAIGELRENSGVFKVSYF